jgi:hypothetical protein
MATWQTTVIHLEGHLTASFLDTASQKWVTSMERAIPMANKKSVHFLQAIKCKVNYMGPLPIIRCTCKYDPDLPMAMMRRSLAYTRIGKSDTGLSTRA